MMKTNYAGYANYLLLAFTCLFIGCSKSEIIDNGDTITNNYEMIVVDAINNKDITPLHLNFIIFRYLSFMNDKYVLNLNRSEAVNLGLPDSIYNKMIFDIEKENTKVRSVSHLQNFSIGCTDISMTKVTVEELNSINYKTVEDIVSWIVSNVSYDLIKHIISGGAMPNDYKSYLLCSIILNPAVRSILMQYIEYDK